MKVVYRLASLLLLADCLVLASFGVLTVRRETQMFETTLIEDARLIGRTLRSALEEVARTEGTAAVASMVHDASSHVGKVDFLWHSEGAIPLDAEDRGRLLEGNEVVLLERGDPGTLRLFLPLALPDRPLEALEVRESLQREEDYVQRTVARIAATTAFLVCLSGGLAFYIGLRVVGRPMEHLAETARRVLPDPPQRRDEIGQLATAFTEMGTQLQAETEHRREVQAQLRHAERLATIGKLASGLAHELGTPLSVVLGRSLEIAEDERCPPALAQPARIVVSQAERMSGIIGQLLDYARRGKPRNEPVRVGDLVHEVVGLLGALARRQGVTVEVLPSGERPGQEPPLEETTVQGDPEQLRQALTNLAVNAIQASPRGGRVTLSVRHEERREPLGAWEVISVEDEGVGIAPEDLPRVFEPFFTTKNAGEGTGLGLAVSHEIATDHGGWIEVESEPGRGTTFRLYVAGEALA
ncbi:MAG: sensor histidine kinase [Planctomycetota bacterium]